MVPWQSLAGTSWSNMHGPVYVQVFLCLTLATELQFFRTGLCLIAHKWLRSFIGVCEFLGKNKDYTTSILLTLLKFTSF